MKKERRRRKFTGTILEKKLLLLFFASSIIPAAVVATALYFLIFNLLGYQVVFPEIIAYSIIPVLKKLNLIIFIGLPLVLAILWLIALEMSHRIAGPLSRLEKELDARISGKESGPIKVREKDEFKSLEEKINKLLNK
jgi:nitrogen fixation/metabolism regulation signal transduction histidine kinase